MKWLCEHKYRPPLSRMKINMQQIKLNIGIQELVKECTESKIDLEYDGDSQGNADNKPLTDRQVSWHWSTSDNILPKQSSLQSPGRTIKSLTKRQRQRLNGSCKKKYEKG